MNLKGISVPQKSFLFLSNEFQKQPYNWVIRFTLVIIINNVCVCKYDYAAVAIFIWNAEIYIYFIYRCVMLPNKLEKD